MNFPKDLLFFLFTLLFPHQSSKCSDFLSFLNSHLECLAPPPLSKSIGQLVAWFLGQCMYTSVRGNGLSKSPSKSEAPHLSSNCWHPSKAMDLGQAAPKLLHISLNSSGVILKGSGFSAYLLGQDTPNFWLGNSSDDPSVHRSTKRCYAVLFKHVS